MAIEHTGRRVFELSTATVLVFEHNPQLARGAGQFVRSFGARKVLEVCRHDDARAITGAEPIDLIIADPSAAKGRAMDFLQWVRRTASQNRFTPIILVASQTPQSLIAVLRQAGGNFIIAKPYTADTLLNRINWVARDKRPFVETEHYTGPCRRVSPGGLPLGARGRRAADALMVNEAQRKAG